MNLDGMNDVTAPVDWSAAAKAQAAEAEDPGYTAYMAARRIVQLIPYTGPNFVESAQDFAAPVAWALCADGQVRVVTLDRDAGTTEVSDVNWWSED
jgi:hypothetical protein